MCAWSGGLESTRDGERQDAPQQGTQNSNITRRLAQHSFDASAARKLQTAETESARRENDPVLEALRATINRILALLRARPTIRREDAEKGRQPGSSQQALLDTIVHHLDPSPFS